MNNTTVVQQSECPSTPTATSATTEPSSDSSRLMPYCAVGSIINLINKVRWAVYVAVAFLLIVIVFVERVPVTGSDYSQVMDRIS